MVLAIACPTANRGNNDVCDFTRAWPAAGAFDRREGAGRGLRRRNRPGSAFGSKFGASTAAPPITSPGISAASIRAAPATTAIPTATYCFIAGLHAAVAEPSVSGVTCKKNVATPVHGGKGCKSRQKAPHFEPAARRKWLPSGPTPGA